MILVAVCFFDAHPCLASTKLMSWCRHIVGTGIPLVPSKQSTGRLCGWTEPSNRWVQISTMKLMHRVLQSNVLSCTSLGIDIFVIGFFQWIDIKIPMALYAFVFPGISTTSNFTCFGWNQSISLGQGEFTQYCWDLDLVPLILICQKSLNIIELGL